MRIFRHWLGLLLCCLLSSQAARAEDTPSPDKPAPIEYETQIVGAPDPLPDDLQDELHDTSQLIALEDKPPSGITTLRRRIEADLERLGQVMHAAGYYDAALNYTLDTTKSPHSVTVTIEPGPIYTLAAVRLEMAEGGAVPDIGGFDPADYGLTLNAPAQAARIVAAEGQIVARYKRHGYPFAQVADRHAVIDTATHTMEVTIILVPGPAARFGALAVEGLDWLDPHYVRDRIGWTEGDIYDQDKVDATRRTLVSSGLFGSVAIQPLGPVAPDGTVPMELKLTERLLHSVGVGAAYGTSEGLSGTLSWEDRNIFGHAEDLSVTAQGGTLTDGLVGKFKVPDLLGFNRDFLSSAVVEKLDDPAFRSIHESLQVGFEQHFTPKLVGDLSIEAEHARLDEKVDFRVYILVGLPASLRWDGTDDLLNPTRGAKAGIQVTPYLRALGSNETFVQSRLDGSLYRRLTDSDTYVVALQGTLGATAGASLDAIPKDHRFYAGGGGSVRGFGFQKAGPLDEFFNPIGGKSLAEASLELRTRITDTIGIVPFVDAGSDYSTALPKLQGKPYVGAGLGLRYFTPVGPVRLDVATPLDPHTRGDAPIQIYVSLGQAF